MKHYVIELESDIDAVMGLRMVLKLAWRRYRLRCVRIVEVSPSGVTEVHANPIIESTGTAHPGPVVGIESAKPARIDP